MITENVTAIIQYILCSLLNALKLPVLLNKTANYRSWVIFPQWFDICVFNCQTNYPGFLLEMLILLCAQPGEKIITIP